MLVLIGFPMLASAHPGHALENAFSGFLHPFTGADHLIVLVSMGAWANRVGGNFRRQLPLVFLSMMLLGWILGCWLQLAAVVEAAIAISIFASGWLLARRERPVPLVRMLAPAGFALAHGVAHGMEVPHNGFGGVFGILFASALLLVVGAILQQVAGGLTARLARRNALTTSVAKDY